MLVAHFSRVTVRSNIDLDTARCLCLAVCVCVLKVVMLMMASKVDLAATAVALQWFDWMPPIVMTQSCPCATTSAIRNSSLRT